MDKNIKVVFAGETGVGKTSIIHQWANNSKLLNPPPTIGASFVSLRINVDDKEKYLGIWDTAGQERYKSLAPMYFRACMFSILVFDLADFESFEKILVWKNTCDECNYIKPVYILVGNKSDKSNRCVTNDTIKDFCDKNNIDEYIETSAQTGVNIKKLLDMISDKCSELKYEHNSEKNINPITILSETNLLDKCKC